jgi:hypothetical protein
MSKRDELKARFIKGYKIIHTDYDELFDSIFFQDEGVEISEVNGLQDALDTIASSELYTNHTPVYAPVGGIEVGETFDNTPVSAILNALLYPFKYPVFNAFTINMTSPVEVGLSTISGQKMFSWQLINSANVSGTIKIIDNQTNQVIASNIPISANQASATIPILQKTTIGTYSWTVSGTTSKGTGFSNVVTVSWRWGIFSGESELDTLDGTTLITLRTKELLTSSSKIYSFNASAGYKYICYPTLLGLKDIFKDTSTNLEVAMLPAYVVSLVNSFGVSTNYYVHRTLNQLGGAINISVS